MTDKKVLRTVFPGDVYESGKLRVTAEGTEVPAGQVEKLLDEARKAGVALFEVPQTEAQARDLERRQQDDGKKEGDA